MSKYTVHALDVWGNAEEGYDVNDVYPSQGVLELDDALDFWSPEYIIRAMTEQGFINPLPSFAVSEVEIDNQDSWISLDYRGRPEFQLRKVEE